MTIETGYFNEDGEWVALVVTTDDFGYLVSCKDAAGKDAVLPPELGYLVSS